MGLGWVLIMWTTAFVARVLCFVAGSAAALDSVRSCCRAGSAVAKDAPRNRRCTCQTDTFCFVAGSSIEVCMLCSDSIVSANSGCSGGNCDRADRSADHHSADCADGGSGRRNGQHDAAAFLRQHVHERLVAHLGPGPVLACCVLFSG